jgi:hypothetical protein
MLNPTDIPQRAVRGLNSREIEYLRKEMEPVRLRNERRFYAEPSFDEGRYILAGLLAGALVASGLLGGVL